MAALAAAASVAAAPVAAHFDATAFATVGVDMDHTFACYNLHETNLVIARGLIRHLRATHAYPDTVFADLERDEAAYDYCFAAKGCVFDVVRGNFLYVTATGAVCCARHGSAQWLSDADVDAVYGHRRRFEWFEPLRSFSRDLHAFLPFNSPFGLPGAQVLARMVDYTDMLFARERDQEQDQQQQQQDQKEQQQQHQPQQPKQQQQQEQTRRPATYQTLAHQLFGAFGELYEPEHLALGRGGFFPELAREPQRYILRTSDAVLGLLRECRARGQRVLLLSNSRSDFVDLVMRAAVGPAWLELFDLVVTASNKPHFFADGPLKGGNFHHSGQSSHTFGAAACTAADGTKVPVLAGGNWRLLREQHAVGADGPVLYFGDDLHGDVAALHMTRPEPHGAPLWHGVAVVEELADAEHARALHVFHCPRGHNVETHWFDAIEHNARLCVPSLHAFAAAQRDGVLSGCLRHGEQGPALWFPLAPRELLASSMGEPR